MTNATADDKIVEFIKDPCIHDWTKDAMEIALSKDPVDAYYGLKVVVDLLKLRMTENLYCD